ncbi:MAG: D-alanyl-D-alanine carboxypeptidase [Faecalibacterium sp.]|nr:D-alanyl-D-alanine carboxypeptidase [Faecalibacterium sp.]
MKKYIACLLAVLVLTVQLCQPAFAVGPAAASEAYLVADADTGQVLISANMDVRKNPASITKVMILGLACEKAQGNWNVQLTVSHEAVYSLVGTGSSHIALLENEVVTLEQMLYAAELFSANDAANVLAEYVSADGTIAGGVEAMNAKADQLGLQNTHFTNPHGITDPQHYTTAADMAVILRWALQQPGFEQLFCATGSYTIPPTNLQSEPRYVSLKDYIRLPGKAYAYVPEVIGSKTGYTDDARYTYVCLAQKDGMRLICVTLHGQQRTDKFSDVKTLLNYTFSNFRRVEIPGGKTAKIPVVGGGPELGQLTYTAPVAQLLLHNDLSPHQVTVQLNVPERYVLGQPFEATAVYTVEGMGLQNSSPTAVALQTTGLEEVLQGKVGMALATSADVTPAKSLVLQLAVGVAVGLGLLFAGVKFFGIGRYNRTRSTAKNWQMELRNR